MEHPKLSPNNEMRCMAFSKDHRRCRLETNGKTCHIHRNYYNNWFSKNITFHPEFLSQRKKKEIIFQFQHMEGVKEYIEGLDQNLDYLDWYSFLIQNYCINPLWNTYLLHVLTIFKINQKEQIGYILINPDICKEVYKSLLSTTIKGVANPHLRDQDYVDLWERNFTDIAEWKQMTGSVFIMSEYKKVLDEAVKKNNAKLVNILEGVVLPCLVSFKERTLPKLRRSLPFKEELVMNRLHPSRIEKMIEEGGMDALDNL
jgi:hypothetical protein